MTWPQGPQSKGSLYYSETATFLAADSRDGCNLNEIVQLLRFEQEMFLPGNEDSLITQGEGMGSILPQKALRNKQQYSILLA